MDILDPLFMPRLGQFIPTPAAKYATAEAARYSPEATWQVVHGTYAAKLPGGGASPFLLMHFDERLANPGLNPACIAEHIFRACHKFDGRIGGHDFSKMDVSMEFFKSPVHSTRWSIERAPDPIASVLTLLWQSINPWPKISVDTVRSVNAYFTSNNILANGVSAFDCVWGGWKDSQGMNETINEQKVFFTEQLRQLVIGSLRYTRLDISFEPSVQG